MDYSELPKRTTQKIDYLQKKTIPNVYNWKNCYNLGVYTSIANTLFIFIHTVSMCSAILVYFFVFSSCSLSKITQNGA